MNPECIFVFKPTNVEGLVSLNIPVLSSLNLHADGIQEIGDEQEKSRQESGVIEALEQDEHAQLKSIKKGNFNAWFYLKQRLAYEAIQFSYEKVLLDKHCKAGQCVYVVSDFAAELQTALPHLTVMPFPVQEHGEKSKISILKLALLGLRFMFSWNFSRKSKTDTLVVERYEHMDFTRGEHKFLGDLGSQFSSLVGPQLDPKKEMLYKSWKGGSKQYRDFDNRRLFVHSLLRFGFWKKLMRFRRELNAGFPSSASTDLEQFLLQRTKRYKGSLVLYYALYLSAISFFKKHKFKRLFLLDEYSPQNKALVDAAASCGIEKWAYQHGEIVHRHLGYLGHANDGAHTPQLDRMYVWGSLYQKNVVKASKMPVDKVKISGNLFIWNCLEKVKTSSSKRHGKFRLMFAGQPLPDANYKAQVFEDLLEVCNMLSNEVDLIIRPHPREDQNVLDHYRKCALQEHIHLETGIGVMDHLVQVDGLITCYSTIGSEFLLLKEGLFFFDYKKEDILNWGVSKVGIPVYSKADLLDKLKNRETYLTQVNKKDLEDLRQNRFNLTTGQDPKQLLTQDLAAF